MMKKPILFVLVSFFTISMSAQSIFDYETPETSVLFQFFGNDAVEGQIPEPVANPNPSGTNMSATVYPFTELPGGQPFAGGFSNPGPDGGIDATGGGQVCLDVHFPEAKTMTLKLENGNADQNWELTVSNDVVNEWAQICFDLTQPGEGNGVNATDHMYATIVLFYGLGEAAETEQNVFIDNITLPDGGADPMAMLILDAETPETSTGLYHFGSTLADSIVAPIANPNPSGVNESATVFELLKPANAQPWAGAFTDPNPITPVDASSGMICVDVHMDHIGTFSVKLEQSQGGAANWIQSASNTLVNEWETVCIDFSMPSLEDPFAPALGDTYNRLVFFADFQMPSSDVDVYTYFDNVRVVPSNETPMFDVTFSVDMNDSGETFDQMYVSGEFNSWSGDANPLNDDDGDNIWTTTLSLPVGTYEYKYTYDNWSGDENLNKTSSCTNTTDGFTNRVVAVTENTDLGTVCYRSCYACGEGVNFTWNLGVADPDPTGVWLAGGAEFGAPGGVYEMTDEDGDGIFSITIERTASFEGYYTFTNGNCPDFSCKEDISGQDCARPENFNDRYLDLGTTEVNTCFAECTESTENCMGAPEPTLTTFSVDMNMQTVSPDGVRIAGQFSNWGDIDMTDDDGDGIYTVTLELNKSVYEYKFKNGPDGWEEFQGGESCTVTTPDGQFTNRVIDLTEADELSESGVFCFESCMSCSVSTDDIIADNTLISLYPTLANDHIILDISTTFEVGEVQILSMDGSVLRTQAIGNQSIGNLINVSALQQGTYILYLTTDAFRGTKKFVKI